MPVTLHQRARHLGAGLLQFLDPFFAGEDRRRRAVAHHANVQPRQRPGDHRRVAHVLDRDALALLSVGIVERVDVILDAHVRHLLDGGAELFHVARDHHRVIAGVEPADGIIERHVGRQRDELVALPRLDVAHRLKAIRHADVHVAAGDGFPGFLKADAARRAAAFDAMAGLGAQAQVILRHDAGHQLARKVIGEIRGHRAIHQFGELGETPGRDRRWHNHTLL